jgi:His-Xaa-Ser system protein HxsD
LADISSEAKNTITLSFKKVLYPKEALLKAAYSFVDKCYVYLDCSDDDYIVALTAKETVLPSNLANEFKNELLSQAVRFQVYQQTHIIREVLMARAMASTLINEKTIEDVSATDTNLDDIIKDWFDKHEQERKTV